MKKLFSRYPKTSFACTGILLIVLTAGISFCGKKKCGGFVKPNFANWFPYQENAQYNFLSNLGNRDTFYVSRSFKSIPYETSGGYYTKTCYANADIISRSLRGLFLNIQADQQDVDFNLSVTLDNFNINSYNIGDSGLLFNNVNAVYAKTSFFANKTIGNKTFTNVQEISLDTNLQKTNIKAIWLSKKVGLVAFTKRSTQETFVLQ